MNRLNFGRSFASVVSVYTNVVILTRSGNTVYSCCCNRLHVIQAMRAEERNVIHRRTASLRCRRVRVAIEAVRGVGVFPLSYS